MRKGLEALEKGKAIQDPTRGKNVQLMSSALAVILGILVNTFKLPLSEEQIGIISWGLVVLYVTVNSYLTVATTDKIGF